MNINRVGKFRVESARTVSVIAEQQSGKYRVQVFMHESGEPCYRILIHDGCSWVKIRCWDDRDERIFPKRAALLGTKMVREQPPTR